MRLAKAGVDVGTHQVLGIVRFDDFERLVGRCIVEDVNFEIPESLLFEALQTRRNIASASECHDIYGNLWRHHFLNAPRRVWPYAAACLGPPTILPPIPAALDARTRAAPDLPKCFLA